MKFPSARYDELTDKTRSPASPRVAQEYPAYLATILDDRDESGRRRRILAARRVFSTEAEAREYLRGLPRFRHAQVLPCFRNLAITRL